MLGVRTDQNQNCVDSASYTFTEYACTVDTTEIQVYSQFDINPVGYNTYSECEIQLENQGCEVQFKPEFIITHENESIEQNDIIIEYLNSQSVWETIDYTINSSGQAIGYWGSESGETLNCDELRIRPIRVKFSSDSYASQGEYTFHYRVWSVDDNSNLIEVISNEISNTLILNGSSPCDITPSGLFVDNIIHNRVTFNWSQPDALPSHYMIRYRPLGTNEWTVMTAGPVNNNPFNGTSRTRYFMHLKLLMNGILEQES